MDERLEETYLRILSSELIPALGCTEPISIALAAAKARQLLGEEPEKAEICCSGNVIKNVKGVKVPNSGGKKGVEIAAALGALGGDPELELEVLTAVSDDQRQKAVEWVRNGKVTYTIKPDVDNLYIEVLLSSGKNTALAVISRYHTRFIHLERNEEVLLDVSDEEPALPAVQDTAALKATLNMDDIITFASSVDVNKVDKLLQRQIEMNTTIAEYGLKNDCGCRVGRTLLDAYGEDVRERAKAYAAAGSDARMSGCTLPVVINSGSGNQGITVSLPVIEYAKALKVSHEKLTRALIISNLVAIHQKYYIGNLSAFCGAVSAAAGAGAGITYLCGGDAEAIFRTVTNTLANAGGIICDGAKASCAAKIASAVDAALMANELSLRGLQFPDGEGIVCDDIEVTMKNVGHVGKFGMKDTDREILRIMTKQVCF